MLDKNHDFVWALEFTSLNWPEYPIRRRCFIPRHTEHGMELDKIVNFVHLFSTIPTRWVGTPTVLWYALHKPLQLIHGCGAKFLNSTLLIEPSPFIMWISYEKMFKFLVAFYGNTWNFNRKAHFL